MTGKSLLFKLSFAGIFFFSSCILFDRSGGKIYTDFFGEGREHCVQILESRDITAFDDPCVWIHFKACPGEIKRILSQVRYKRIPLNKIEMNDELNKLNSTAPPEWWDISKLGDSCLSFEYFHTDKDYAQFAYISYDSTEVFYHDVMW